jgi:tetratricopeptide (TPR) repeat protein
MYLTATHQGPDAYAYEDFIFGHGVFSYFLLRGLESGEAHAPDSRFITAASLSNYVETWVQHATTSTRDRQPRQKPTPLLGVPLGYQIADVQLNGPDPKYGDNRPLADLVIPDERLGKRRRQAPVTKQAQSNPAETPVGPPANLDRGIALEDEGEAIMLRYLEGDEVPQRVEDFRRCASVFAEALSLQPGSPYLEARKAFCDGRTLVFDKHYDAAIVQVERAIRLDPTAAYSYNALGIAYLEKGDYPMAQAAFDDAIGRAPAWAYPRHNLALVHTQAGNYAAAVLAYRDAMERAPEYSYLPYNLGLLFQRMNRLDDAEAQYLAAIGKANRNPPGRSEPYIALGALKASQRKWKDANDYYRKALTIPAGELTLRTARHNLAVLLARKDAGWAEAQRLLRQNGDYVPSELVLAEALATRGQTNDAIQVYREILSALPDHLASRLQLAAELEKDGDRAAAVFELRTALARQPDNPVILERLAANLARSGSETEAAALYRLALSHSEPALRSRIQKALKRLERVR